MLPLKKWMSLSPETVAWMELLGPSAQEEFLVLGLNSHPPSTRVTLPEGGSVESSHSVSFQSQE